MPLARIAVKALLALLFTSQVFAAPATVPAGGTAKLNPELIEFLYGMAVSLSGYPAIPAEKMPSITFLSEQEIVHEICPNDPLNCRKLAAFYHTETNRVVVLNTLDMENDTDNSFLVHELVHALQYHRDGDAIYATCPASRKTEQEAYDVQNRYLKKSGQFARFGEGLRFWTCPEDEK